MSSLPPRHILSKSTFLRGCQCDKSLWLYKHHYNKRDIPDVLQQHIFQQGTDVGMLARQLFGRGVDVSPANVFQYRESVRDTAKCIAEGNTVIFEAAFQYQGVMCAVDVLIKHKEKWYAYEVKSSTDVKPQFIHDAALQDYVITNAGLPLEDFFIVYVNSNYIRKGPLELKQLFTKQSVKSNVIEMQPAIHTQVTQLLQVATSAHMPATPVGVHCTKPYLCDFFSYCHTDSLQSNPSLTQQLPTTIGEPDSNVHISIPQNFIDLQTYRIAVPGFDGHWPYMYIPYQFTLFNYNNTEISAQHFAADILHDPVVQSIQALIKSVEHCKKIAVINKQQATTIINQLIRFSPNHTTQLQQIIEGLVEIDLPQITLTQKASENEITNDVNAALHFMRIQNQPNNDNVSGYKLLQNYALQKYLHTFQLQSKNPKVIIHPL